MEDLLVIKNVDKIYGEGKNACKALENISFTIKEGDFIGIMGPSGAGKSTLLNIIATIIKPTKGEISINGERIDNKTDEELCKYRRKEIGFIFQDCNLLDTLTIRDNILAPLELIGLSFRESNERLKRVSEKMKITDILDKFPAECSGGQKQRAAACRALAMNPLIIVADEPTGALDSKNSSELLRLLKDLNENDGITIVMVTHDYMIASYSEKLLFIRDGVIDEVISRGKQSQSEFYNKILTEGTKETNSLFDDVI
ncbi:ABC transporter ATP-binding protein [Clostridium sp. LP20]|uniref:ABC transporter ATP-binding protein n=1 Tax=Clostridium sp. LP20 TaxID=3418665 RepID=UPI003EE7BB71